jgi:hypothetical protein
MRTINNPGLRTIILGHEKRASSNLFQIVKRFHVVMRPAETFNERHQVKGRYFLVAACRRQLLP